MLHYFVFVSISRKILQIASYFGFNVTNFEFTIRQSGYEHINSTIRNKIERTTDSSIGGNIIERKMKKEKTKLNI